MTSVKAGLGQGLDTVIVILFTFHRVSVTMNYETNYEEQKFFDASFDLIQQIMGCGFDIKNQSERVSSISGTFQNSNIVEMHNSDLSQHKDVYHTHIS